MTPDDRDRLQQIALEFATEVERAMSKHAPMNTPYEAWAVIREELDEFWDEVRAWQPGDQRKAEMRKELTQTAAMCLRAIVDLEL